MHGYGWYWHRWLGIAGYAIAVTFMARIIHKPYAVLHDYPTHILLLYHCISQNIAVAGRVVMHHHVGCHAACMSDRRLCVHFMSLLPGTQQQCRVGAVIWRCCGGAMLSGSTVCIVVSAFPVGSLTVQQRTIPEARLNDMWLATVRS